MARVTTKVLSQAIGYSEDTIRQWAREQRIPGERLGPQWRFDIAQVLASLQIDQKGGVSK